MNSVRKFLDLPEGHEFRSTLKERGIDPNVIAEIGEIEGDSLDFVEITMSLEESLGITLTSSEKVDLTGQGN